MELENGRLDGSLDLQDLHTQSLVHGIRPRSLNELRSLDVRIEECIVDSQLLGITLFSACR